MQEPLVSILIPCYNCAAWVHRSIETALSQTWAHKEIIVLDDGSTDGSLRVVQRYAARVRIVAQPNSGQNVSRNRLTDFSRGEWLVYLDADDELWSDTVTRKMALRRGVDAVFGSMEVAEFQGADKLGSETMTAQNHADPWVAAFHWKYPNTSSFLFNRQALLRAGGWNEQIKNCTDYDVYFRLLLAGCRFMAAPKALSLYRQWSVGQAVNQAPLRKMRTRLDVMWNAAIALEKSGGMIFERRQAFLDAALGVIRSIYPVDQRIAKEEHRRLVKWDSSFKPSIAVFPRRYVRAYNLLGFALAERLAAAARAVEAS